MSESITNQPVADRSLNQGGLGQGQLTEPTKVNVGTLPADATCYTVGSQVNVGPIKPVDRKTLEGSTPGDFRSQAADVTLPNQPGPRDQTGTEGA